MADENVEVKEVATHGAPQPPAEAPRTKQEHEALNEVHAPAENKGKQQQKPEDKAPDKQPEKKDEPKTYTQAELDALVEEAKKKHTKDWSEEYVELENEAGQAVIDLLKEAEVSPAEANSYFQDAIESGDLSKVNWAALEKKLGPAKAKLAKAGIQSYYNEVYVAQQQTVSAVYEVAGGEDNWKAIRDWAQSEEKTDPAFAAKVREYRKALDIGGFAAVAAVRELKEAYTASPNTKGLDNKTIVKGDKVAEPVGGPLSKAEYLKLRNEAERNGASEKEIAVLAARRKAGMVRERAGN